MEVRIETTEDDDAAEERRAAEAERILAATFMDEEIVCMAEGTELADVPIIREFSDVFPEDLPGKSPDRDIQFSIELKPGTTPISIRPYRMDVKDLAELKKLSHPILKDKIERTPYVRPGTKVRTNGRHHK